MRQQTKCSEVEWEPCKLKPNSSCLSEGVRLGRLEGGTGE